MAGRKLAVNTTALDEDGRMVTFPAGTVVSAKVAEGITNPKVWADEDDAPQGYSSQGKADLEAEVAKRNEGRDDADLIVVGGKGNKPDLIAALEADDEK